MKKIIIQSLIFLFTISLLITACKKEEGPMAMPENPSFIEEFDTIANMLEKGWAISNNSQPIGTSSWNPGVLTRIDPGTGGKTVVPPSLVTGYPFYASSATYSGKDFLLASFNSGDKNATISCWLISKPTLMKNGDVLEFFTRSAGTDWNTSNKADRLQVMLNTLNNSANVGNTATSVGSFTTKLLDINETYQKTGANAYPKAWTKYTCVVSGLAAPVYRRFGFRYFVENGGEDGSNSYAIGIDRVQFTSK